MVSYTVVEIPVKDCLRFYLTADYPNLDQLRIQKHQRDERERVLKSARQNYAPMEVNHCEERVDYDLLSINGSEVYIAPTYHIPLE